MTQGRRVYPTRESPIPVTEPGDYGQDNTGRWWVIPPKPGIAGGVLTLHGIELHEDGTITVTGSILLPGHHGASWHGYLERGEWREV